MNGITKLTHLLTLAITLLAVSACTVNQPEKPNDPNYAPVLEVPPRADPISEGSLYQENTAIGLFTDRKAMRVGDIITVVLREKTSSSKSSNVEMNKETDISISPDASTGTIFGKQPTVGSFGLTTGLGSDNAFVGEADADQSNQLSGNISVTVVDIYPNGTLAIRGEKWMTLNRGDEFLRISGLVRPDDVSPDNTVSSTKIANARITYSGTGDFSDNQSRGWLARFFSSPIWPF